jgi:malate dehydrogenase
MLGTVAVVGAGNVGATAAQRLAEKNLARTVVMIDVVEGVPQGKALDQWQSGPIEGFDTRVIGTNGYDQAAGADLFVVTAGIARKPGMSRDDLVKTNAGIVRSVAKEIARVAPKSIIVVVSNPLDVMCYVAMRASGFPRERVLGMAGVLDTARYRTFLAEAMDVSVEDIQAMVLGGHGDTMVPLVSYTTVSGIPVSQLLAPDKLAAIVDRTRNGGAEIVAFLKTGSAYYAPSAAAVQMVEAIALDKRRILPCSAWLQGEFGLKDVFCGVPCRLGHKGLEGIIDIKLTDAERADLVKSAEAVRATQAVVDAA